MNYLFDIANSAKDAWGARICSKEELETLQDSKVVRSNCMMASEIFEHWESSFPDSVTKGLKDKAAKYKIKLPVILPHAHFTDGHRCNASAVESGLMSMDFDHIEKPREYWEKMLKPHIDDLHIVWAFVSPTGTGVKVVSVKPKNLTLEEAQAWFAGVISEKEYDHTHDLARCVYMVPKEFNLYYAPERLFGEMEVFSVNGGCPKSDGENRGCPKSDGENGGCPKSDGENGGCPKSDGENGNENGNGSKEVDNKEDNTSKSAYISKLCKIEYDENAEYDGHKYIEIIEAFWKQKYGKLPKEGMRHQALLDWVREGASICEYDGEMLMKVTPRLDKPVDELAHIIVDTLGWKKKNFRPTMPYVLSKVLSSIGVANTDEKKAMVMDKAVIELNEYYLSQLPKLPPIMRAVLKTCDRKYHMPVLMGLMPVLSNYAERIIYRYSTGQIRRPALQCLVVGPAASGKSSVTQQLEYALKEMRADSKEAREKQDEIRKKNMEKADNQEGQTFTSFIKYLNMNITDAELLYEQKIASKLGCKVGDVWLPRKQFMFTEEAGVVMKAAKNSNILSAWRCDFDFGEWGKDVHSDNSVSGLVNLSFDFTALCTQGVLTQLLSPENRENGTASRLIIVPMPSGYFEYMPYFKTLTDKDKADISAGIERMKSAVGFIEHKQLMKYFREWSNNMADTLRANFAIQYEEPRKRAGIIGFVCSLFYALLEYPKIEDLSKLKVSNNAKLFGKVVAEYYMETQVKVFKEFAEGETVQASTIMSYKKTKNQLVLDSLPDVFTREDLKNKKPTSSDNVITKTISNWKQENLIQEIGKNTYRKLTYKEIE